MNPTVEIDEIDAKILRELIADARVNLVDIAKECGLSSTAVLKRIRRLRAEGIILSTVFFSDMERVGYMYPASIEISLDRDQEAEVLKVIEKKVNVLMLSRSVGKDNLFIFVVAKSLQEIESLKQIIKGHPGIKRITVNIWSTPTFNFENISLQRREA